MTKRQFLSIKLLIAILLVTITSTAINLHNFIIAPIAIVLATIILLVLRKRISEVTADERDYNTAGTAARYTIYTFTMVALFIGLTLACLPNTSVTTQSISDTLLYSVCAITILQTILFYTLNGNKN